MDKFFNTQREAFRYTEDLVKYIQSFWNTNNPDKILKISAHHNHFYHRLYDRVESKQELDNIPKMLRSIFNGKSNKFLEYLNITDHRPPKINLIYKEQIIGMSTYNEQSKLTIRTYFKDDGYNYDRNDIYKIILLDKSKYHV